MNVPRRLRYREPMFTDFFIADPAEAEEIAYAEDEGARADLTIGITDLELIDLTRILLKKDYEPRLAFASEAEELYVLEMDPRLVDALAELEGERLDHVWERWSGTEAFAETPADEVREALQALAALAAEAKRVGKPVLQLTAI